MQSLDKDTLAPKRALLIGAGGLGCPSALALAKAGVGTLGLSDSDRVDLSNLHRQILYRGEDIGRPKTNAAKERLRALFPRLKIEALPAVTPESLPGLLSGWDVVLDGTDSIALKFAISDACVKAKVPLVHAGVVRHQGLLLTVNPGGPCYRCFFEAPPPPHEVVTCQEAGVLGAAAGFVGALQAAEALKVLLQIEPLLSGKMLTIDLKSLRLREVAFRKNPSCPACSAINPG